MLKLKEPVTTTVYEIEKTDLIRDPLDIIKPNIETWTIVFKNHEFEEIKFKLPIPYSSESCDILAEFLAIKKELCAKESEIGKLLNSRTELQESIEEHKGKRGRRK